MLIIWGSRLYGKVDAVPGMFHVATQFGHLWYIPLIPMGSHVVVSQEGNGWRGMPIPFSFKSMLTAWVRGALIVATILACFTCFAVLSDPRHTAASKALPVLAACALLSATILSWRWKWVRLASYERAVQLAELLKFTDEGRIMIELHYGRISPADAEKAMKQAAEDRAELAKLKEEPAIPISQG
jgi:hypothetical protein